MAGCSSLLACAALLSGVLILAACGERPRQPPAGFSPAHQVVRVRGRVARCNTVHSLTLPAAVISRYGLHDGAETGVISCSLQLLGGSGLGRYARHGTTPVNVRALIFGSAQPQNGSERRLDFREVLDRGSVSYVANFALAAASRIDFDVRVYDPIAGGHYHLEFEQIGLPDRAVRARH